MSGDQLPMVERLKKATMNLQFVWFLGHLMTAIQSIFCFFYSGFWNYYKAFYGTLVSYGIILYKSHGKPSFDKEYLGRVLQDENTQYFFLAIVWATAPPIRVALFPYAVFSLFHTLGYIRSELIPKTFPGSTFPQAKTVASAINSLMLKFQPKSIWAVSRVEVWVIFPMTVISIFWGGTSIFTPVLYQQFLQFRFLSSPMTREVFSETEIFLDKHILNNQKVPEWGRNGYSSAKEMIQKYCNLEARARAAQVAQ